MPISYYLWLIAICAIMYAAESIPDAARYKALHPKKPKYKKLFREITDE